MNRIQWNLEVENLAKMTARGDTMTEIGDHYGVSSQRIYQVCTKYGVSTPIMKQKNFLREKSPKYYWANKMLSRVLEGTREDKLELLDTIDIPDVCPMLGILLNYDGTGREGYTRADNSPSIDRIDCTKGYTKDNIHIISWRANRIKNDSTIEELYQIYNYLVNLQK